MQDFLPVTKKEMKQRGWEQVDFAYITGDATIQSLKSTGRKIPIHREVRWDFVLTAR